MRALGLAIVVLVTSGGCGGEPPAAGPAGEVVRAAGEVHATRASERRTLAVGAEVYRDDEVETGADGSAAIRLRHNGATWNAVDGVGGLPMRGGGGKGGTSSGYIGQIGPKGSVSRARVTESVPVVDGALDATVVRRTMRRHRARFQRCYEDALKRDPSLNLVVRLSFTVLASGKTANAKAEVQPAHAELHSCVIAAVRVYRFPSADRDTAVQVTLRFRPAE